MVGNTRYSKIGNKYFIGKAIYRPNDPYRSLELDQYRCSQDALITVILWQSDAVQHAVRCCIASYFGRPTYPFITGTGE